MTTPALPETNGELVILRGALENAKKTILAQDNRLKELTGPPFTYATVVALSGWREDKTSTKNTYTDTTGDKVNVTTNRKTLAGFNLGDSLSFIDSDENSRVLGAIKRAKKLVIVGFLNDQKIVVQIDEGPVIVDSPEVISKVFQVTEIGTVGLVNTAVIALGDSCYEVVIPKDIVVNYGDTVKVVKDTMQIIDIASVQLYGEIGYVTQVASSDFAEVELPSVTKFVFSGRYGASLEKGDRVVLDQTATVIVHNLGKEDKRFKFTGEANVSWSDIAGLENAKELMIEVVELPYRNPKIVEFYHKKRVKSVLLYGPPGCGKTMIGKATATSLAKISNEDSGHSGFIYIKGPEILERYVGVAESVIRQIFERARKHKKDFGFPAVIFIDEAEALLSKRGSGISSDVEKTIVPMFCAEMDGFEDSGALVILASNRPDILDPAIIRDGRVDYKIMIERPNKENAANIFLLNLKGVPLNNGSSYEDLANLAIAEIFRTDRVLHRIDVKDGGVVNFTLKDIINGAMVAGIVEKAISIAMRRDIANQEQGGLRKEDIILAIDLVEKQNRDLNHTEEITAFTANLKDDFADIQKFRRTITQN